MTKFKEAFLAGFNASGEGWNGEHGVTNEDLELIYSDWLETRLCEIFDKPPEVGDPITPKLVEDIRFVMAHIAKS